MTGHLRFFQRSFIFVLLLFFLSQCGGQKLLSTGNSSDSSSSSSSGSTTNDVVGGNVSELSLSSGASQIDLSGVSDSENVLLLLFSYNSGSTTEGFQISNSQITSFLRDGDVAWLVDEVDDGVEIEGQIDVTEDLHHMLREKESEIYDADEVLPPSRYVRFATLGSEKEFRVLNSFSNSSSYDTVTATLRYETEYFQFYVDNRDADALTDSDLQELAEDFADVIPTENEMFGTESDVNGDDKFAVLFTRTVNELGGSAGGIVTGFFYAVDLFSRSQYAISNEMEVFYTFVPDPSGEFGSAISKSFAMSNILPTVLPHEYQHMISFNQHYFLNGGSAESGWLNEGLSHLAEDIYSLDQSGYMTTTGNENPARVAVYLTNISNICFTCGTSLSQRGGSYLFLRYLYEQAAQGFLENVKSGTELIQELLNTSDRGVSNVVKRIYGSSASDDEFKTLLSRFSLAVYLSNTTKTSDERYHFDGINLRSAQSDNRGTVLNGPAVQSISNFPFTDTLSGNSVTYLQISGEEINENGGQIHFDFDNDADFGGYIIRQ